MNPGIIYMAISPSGKTYIGQTIKTLNRRKTQHYSAAFNRKSKIYNSKLSRAIRRYGTALTWIVVEEDIALDHLDDSEIYYISIFDSYKNGYNATLGGKCQRGFCHSESTKAKISSSLKGIRRSSETRKKISNSKIGKKNPNFGKHPTLETRKKISIAQRGNNHYLFGKHMSEKTKSKLSKINKGKHLSTATKNKMSASRSGERNSQSKLTWETVEKIRSEYATKKYTYKQLASRYAISITNVSLIINNQVWKK